MMSKIDGKTFEHMTNVEKAECFRKLQRWYNNMKVGIDELEVKYAKLQNENNTIEARNVQLLKRLDFMARMYQDQITISNADKNNYLERIQKMELIIKQNGG